MSEPLAALLVDYALGILSDDRRAEVEAELARSAKLQQELAEIEEALASLALELPPLQPEPDRRDVLLAAIEDQHRYARFTDQLAELFDVAKEQVRAILGWIADPRRWEPGGMPGVEMLRCEPGPKAAAWQVGFLRFAPGLLFPPHRHLGRDYVLVMDGEFTDLASGDLHTTGDLVIKEQGTAHSFRVSQDESCLLATRFPGIEILPPP